MVFWSTQTDRQDEEAPTWRQGSDPTTSTEVVSCVRPTDGLVRASGIKWNKLAYLIWRCVWAGGVVGPSSSLRHLCKLLVFNGCPAEGWGATELLLVYSCHFHLHPRLVQILLYSPPTFPATRIILLYTLLQFFAWWSVGLELGKKRNLWKSKFNKRIIISSPSFPRMVLSLKRTKFR